MERGVSGERAGARFVCTIRDPAFSTNWLCPCQLELEGEKAHEQEKSRENSAALAYVWIPLVTQTMFVPSNTGFDLGWSCFLLFFLSLVLFPLIFPVVCAAG